jgi:hypothetical protein
VPLTLPAADLLLTKLQIVRLNEKDRNDAYALLLALGRRYDRRRGHQRGLGGPPLRPRLGALPDAAAEPREAARGAERRPAQRRERDLITQRLAAIETAMEDEPKGSKWKLRARVGDKVRWYEDPEEVERHGY